MTRSTSSISSGAQSFNWLIDRFAENTAGVIAAIAVSADGLLIATSDAVERAGGDRLAAIASATLGLANGVSDSYPLGLPDGLKTALGVDAVRQGHLDLWPVFPPFRGGRSGCRLIRMP